MPRDLRILRHFPIIWRLFKKDMNTSIYRKRYIIRYKYTTRNIFALIFTLSHATLSLEVDYE